MYFGASLLGKARKILHIMKKLDLNPSMTYLIGDEVRDVEAALAAGIYPIPVSWGFSARIALEVAIVEHTGSRLNGRVIADTPNDILAMISELIISECS